MSMIRMDGEIGDHMSVAARYKQKHKSYKSYKQKHKKTKHKNVRSSYVPRKTWSQRIPCLGLQPRLFEFGNASTNSTFLRKVTFGFARITAQQGKVHKHRIFFFFFFLLSV